MSVNRKAIALIGEWTIEYHCLALKINHYFSPLWLVSFQVVVCTAKFTCPLCKLRRFCSIFILLKSSCNNPTKEITSAPLNVSTILWCARLITNKFEEATYKNEIVENTKYNNQQNCYFKTQLIQENIDYNTKRSRLSLGNSMSICLVFFVYLYISLAVLLSRMDYLCYLCKGACRHSKG